ncbi:peptidase S8 and S53 subtilisin kexin sedolisin [Tribonema minus]|uniref:subtilisin n=1 Tax=Tribonema minus TaxID=303371 RepID=A0A835Z0S1_9STRA|nr:peptidase S8 and S53 subtilisin kexin sedolisin [Tribonema minus]
MSFARCNRTRKLLLLGACALCGRLVSADMWRIVYEDPAPDVNADHAAGPDASAASAASAPTAIDSYQSSHATVASLIAADPLTDIDTFLPEFGLAYATASPEAAARIEALPGVQSVTPVQQEGMTFALGIRYAFTNASACLRFQRAILPSTGFWLDHPAIAPNINRRLSKSFIPGEGLQFKTPRNQGDSFSHGTWTASLIAAAHVGNSGIRGVAPAAELVLVKVLSDNGWGSDGLILKGMKYAADSGVDIINMSLGLGPLQDTKSTAALLTAYKRAVRYVLSKGVAIIAAAGNDSFNFDDANDQSVYVPQDVKGVIVVSATGPKGWRYKPTANMDRLSYYSNYGANVVDFAAPGGDIRSMYADSEALCYVPVIKRKVKCYQLDAMLGACCYTPEGGYGYRWAMGTSAAAPVASGVAALIVSKLGHHVPPAKLEMCMRKTAEDLGEKGRDASYGWGLVNAGNVVDLRDCQQQ